MRLGFHYHVPAVQKYGRIYMPGYLGRFIDSLAAQCDSIICFMHTPRPDEGKLMDYALNAGNVTLIGLGKHTSLPNRVLHAHQVTRIVENFRDQMDAMLIRGPSPLLPWVAKAAQPIPISLLLVGDQLAGVDDLSQPRWRKEAIRLFWKCNTSKQLKIARSSLTFVNSHLLYTQLEGKLSQLVETRTTTLEETDFFLREDTCQKRPIHLLYTGRMYLSKGLLDIVNALALLVENGEDVMLDLVGWAENSSTVLSDIQALSQERGVVDRVIYHGYRPVGPELFAFYRKADIYVIASQSSFEGFPRTIWEAMANSLPVVATKVGSIPDFISQEAELVEPNNPADLASVISGLIHNSDKRRDHITKGLVLAHKNSLENQVGKMAKVIKDWLASKSE